MDAREQETEKEFDQQNKAGDQNPPAKDWRLYLVGTAVLLALDIIWIQTPILRMTISRHRIQAPRQDTGQRRAKPSVGKIKTVGV